MKVIEESGYFSVYDKYPGYSKIFAQTSRIYGEGYLHTPDLEDQDMSLWF